MFGSWTKELAAEDLRGRLKWFLFGRVVVISTFLGAVSLLYLRSGEERYAVSVNRLLLIIAFTYVFSILSALSLERIRRLNLFTHAQIGYDTLLITGVVYLTGGLESPFAFLYSLPIINAAGLLFGSGALVAALMAAMAYSSLVFALATGLLSGDLLASASFNLQHGLRFATMNATFFLIAYLAGMLTRRLRAMQELVIKRQAERDQLAAMQETLARTLSAGVITTDPEGRITSVDATAERIGAHPAGELLGSDIGSLFPPLQLTPSARRRFLQSTDAVKPIEFHFQANGAAPSELRCLPAPLRDTYGHLIGALYIFQDVTKLKELERTSAPAEEVEEICREDLEAAEELAGAADGLYGVSPAMTHVRKLIDRVAASDATLLLTGESGTGKELVARAVHARSPRRDKPFVAINCGAIPEHLIESELFGHVRGAFTGAVADRSGCFRSADFGTLFLDEIGELPLHLQVKLLRVLQERVFRPVGSETNVAVNVRIIAASNKDLLAEVKAGRFREDLFYRLNVVTIHLPPLRERREDIPLLIRHFLRQFCDLHGRHVSGFSVGASKLLLQYSYPGNVRELENLVEHAVALCDGETATQDHLPAYLMTAQDQVRKVGVSRPAAPQPILASVASPPPDRSPVDLDRDLAEYEKAVLLRALDQAGGVKKKAAELLGINYRSLRHRLQKYGISDSMDDVG